MANEVTPRGRLFRKHVVVFVSLVTGALLASGAIEIYFTYEENTAALVAVQREKAASAASQIEGFIKEIERQVGWTTQPQLAAGTAALDQRRFDYLRLLRQVLAITELTYLDSTGKEQLRVSRLAMDVVGSQADVSQEPKFRVAKTGKTYYGPVYFRKESEPYMTMAMAGSGRDAGVTVAEVNLKFIWDVVSKIKIGKAGHAYVTDRQGSLIAHPDISLVLQKTNMSALPQIQEALTGASRPDEQRGAAAIAQDLQGRRILTAHAVILPLGWAVFVEQPLEEALEPLRASIQRTILLVVLGVALAIVASLILARRMVRPIQALQTGAARIGAGELGHRIQVQTGDEVESLADQFNRMAGQLEESYAGLEQKVEDRTRELRETLEQQTATAEILRVISSSPTDLQPVMDAVALNAARVCGAHDAVIFRIDGDLLQPVAVHGPLPALPLPLTRGSVTGRAVIDRRTVHIEDLAAAPETEFPEGRVAQRRRGHRTTLATPLLREGVPIGAILIRRMEVRPFSEKQVELLKTFADQAVIAIENVRLFQELQTRSAELARSVEELRALGEVSRAVSSTLDMQTVLTTIVSRAAQLSGTSGGVIYEYDEAAEEFRLTATYRMESELIESLRGSPIRLGDGAMGRAAVTRAPVQVSDILDESGTLLPRVRAVLARSGYRSVLAIPLLQEEVDASEQRIVGGLVVWRQEVGEFSLETVSLLQTFATQSVLAIQNARLFREIEAKSRQLEVADRHKSEFLANMSHELRTPLNAIIGFSEVLLEHMFGEVNPKQEEYLKDILASGRHLLSLINDILDLSKIEAGRMELDLGRFDLPAALENTLTLVRDRASRHAITLEVQMDPELGEVVADERKLKQIVLNLLSNAVKFTPEGGRIALTAALANGSVEIAVSDTGIGIAAEDQERIFEEFRQVGSDYVRKREGTGLGLALTKRFVELHGGRVWVKSAPGQGATFTFTLPLRPWPVS